MNLFRTTLESGGLRVNNLILFGSSGSGTYRPGSDIDLAVISDDFTGKDIFTRVRMTGSFAGQPHPAVAPVPG